MNIILDPSILSFTEIFLADKKRNILINGYFTKIIYSNQYITINSIYYTLQFESTNITRMNGDMYMQYDTHNSHNNNTIKRLAYIEYKLLEYYKQVYNLSVNISTSIEKRLQYGKIKISCDENSGLKTTDYIVVKISGIWETVNEIGLAIKFFPARQMKLTV